MNSQRNLKPDIKASSLEEFLNYFSDQGLKSFHAKQLFKWIYQKGAEYFEDMTDLSADLRKKLKNDFAFSHFSPEKVLTSKDGTKKFLFAVGENEYIESVIIPSSKRTTLCISSQVGCKFACRFCASGLNGFSRNLTTAEILNQILYIKNHEKGAMITHVVFMGVGEPMDNYDNVFKSIRIINSSSGLNIAARRITVSTCGLIPQIRAMAKEGLQIELAVSLHAANNTTRSQLMPVNRKDPLDKLLATCKSYSKATKRQITFEYVLIKGVNDSQEDARQLARQVKGMLCKINLITCNQVKALACCSADRQQAVKFQNILLQKGILVTIRAPRGEDIAAACGQLRYSLSKKKR
ncbi:MAG: 23S rRNA (adenine(2503)-C(2))-methyltransferase RlmN [Candidatus Aceula meridiana]|nr:23S rRNA (adenine(2503)-C(2))-methyltransferase RlmN [Candidatus Aceula meridiana]